uniref:Uncharacterized protein n=1 Tax=Anguilla anguilla TaxID=7936 RepID=A0A0E9SJ60_ANGAN
MQRKLVCSHMSGIRTSVSAMLYVLLHRNKQKLHLFYLMTL